MIILLGFSLYCLWWAIYMHFLKSNFLHCKIVGLALLFMFSRSATADDHDLDTQLRLNQNIEQQNNSKESELLKDEDYLSGKRPELILDGKSYTVGHNANDIGRALYVSIKQKQGMPSFTFSMNTEHFPMLIHFYSLMRKAH